MTGKVMGKVKLRTATTEKTLSDILVNATIVGSKGIGQGSVARGLLRKVDWENKLIPNAMVQDLAEGEHSAV